MSQLVLKLIVVQTQITIAYRRILPKLDHNIRDTIFNIFLNSFKGYGRSKDGKCPSLKGNENCAFRFLNSEFENNPCTVTGQDFECPDDEKCCDDGCGGYECKPAIGLPQLPIIGKNQAKISSHRTIN